MDKTKNEHPVIYLAHISKDGREQTNLEHLVGVAKMAGEFALPFDARELAYQAGLAHDLGKYGARPQARLRGGPKADHSTAGAVELFKRGNPCGAFCVAGHHAGLPDGGSCKDIGGSTLLGRLRKGPPEDYSAWQKELTLPVVTLPAFRDNFEAAFFTRMLFSCLVDADFLDTEQFMAGHPLPRGTGEEIPVLLEKLRNHVANWLEAPEGNLNQKRSDILRRCIRMGQEGPPGLYSLTVPTGGGKTISSLAFALEHAVARKKRRVVYVIPYTSIIDQTVDTFRKILGVENVLAHHSGVEYKDTGEEDESEVEQSLRLATENWDAPVIVTTNVQFFESLFSNRSSRCRKLHRLADSVVIFDEAQMLPLPFLRPCLRAVGSLVEGYGVTAVLCTATQPPWEKFFPGLPITEICPEVQELQTVFRRVTLRREGELTQEALAQRMSACPAALAVLNSRANAVELYRLLPKEGRFCLTTLMAPVHRRRVLEEIGQRLKANPPLPCYVAATSLIEAGVDLDFPAVFREEAGLDSILQAAGRCNREGRNSSEASIVTTFTFSGRIPDELDQSQKLFHETAQAVEDITSPEAVRLYFEKLHNFRGTALDSKKIIDAFQGDMPFARVAKEFQLIQSEVCPVLIPLPGSEELIAALRAGKCSRSLLRQAGQHTVSVYPWHCQALLESGACTLVLKDTALLTDLSRYKEETGLDLVDEGGRELIF